MGIGKSVAPREEEPRKKAVVLLSGGLDSATCLEVARRGGYALYCLSIDYGQRHRAELSAAVALADRAKAVEHKVVKFDLSVFGGSSLVGDGELPKGRFSDDEIPDDEIPSTYVPARNLVFLSLAAAWADAIGSEDIFIGTTSLDHAGYPDCTETFLQAFALVASVGCRPPRMRVNAPLIALTKSEIIKLGLSMGVDYSITRTCFDLDTDGFACGECDACVLRRREFMRVGVEDPAPYKQRPFIEL